MKGKIPDNLIDKYLRNECSKEEEEFLLDWYSSFESDPDPVENLSKDQQKALKGRMLGKIRGTLNYDKTPFIPRGTSGRLRVWYSVISLAAACVLVFLALTFYFREGGSPANGNFSFKDNATISNRSETLRKFILPDGSSVWLKASSSLTYLSKPGDKTREVDLKGEGFFDIKQDKHRPFIIHAGDFHTRVLGTSFNISAYGDTRPSEVSVVSGKVLVYVGEKDKRETGGVTLLPAQKAVYKTGSRTISKEKETGNDLKIWEKRSVSFKDESLKNVAEVLNEKFDVKIQIDDRKIEEYSLNADFTGQSLPDILEMISKSLDVSCEITDNHILIKGNSN